MNQRCLKIAMSEFVWVTFGLLYQRKCYIGLETRQRYLRERKTEDIDL